MGTWSIWHWLIVLAVVLVIFGTKKLRNVGSDLGSAVKGFKEGMKSGEDAAAQAKAEIASTVYTLEIHLSGSLDFKEGGRWVGDSARCRCSEFLAASGQQGAQLLLQPGSQGVGHACNHPASTKRWCSAAQTASRVWAASTRTKRWGSACARRA